MSYLTEGVNLGRFRDSTKDTAPKMAGVTFGRFWCKKCDQSKPVLGRKSAGFKNGFICAECAAK